MFYFKNNDKYQTFCNNTVFIYLSLCVFVCVSIIQVILASAFIPVFSGLSPPRYRGFRVIGNISTADWLSEKERGNFSSMFNTLSHCPF